MTRSKRATTAAAVGVGANGSSFIVYRLSFKCLFTTCYLLAAAFLLALLQLTTYNLQPVYAASGVNNFINIQGKVTNKDGTNVADGTYDFVFKLYNGASSSSTNTFTESWTSAALWSSTMSSAPAAGGESLTYSSDTNESTIKAGEFLWNTTKKEAVKVVAVNTTTNVVTISSTAQAWNTTDTITNKIYVQNGIFQVALNSLNADANWGTTDFTQDTIYLGINFNSDGEMKPRSQFTAVPYAFRAKSAASVDGLSVASGKTLTVNNTLSFSGTDSTSFTLPTASDTLVGLAANQALTNKTVNGLNITSTTGTLAIAAGKTLTANNSIGLSGVDGKTLTLNNSLTLAGADGKTINFGSNSLTFTTSGATNLTLPTSGTLLTSASAFVNNGNSFGGLATLGTNDFSALAFKTNGTEQARFDTSGNLGIGTTNPAQKLDIAYGNLRMDTLSAPSAPTSTANAATGLTGAYKYCVTFVTAAGETTCSAASNTVNPSNQKIDVTNIATDSTGNAIERNLYRTKAGGSTFFLLTTIYDNTTTQYLNDATADGSLGTAEPPVDNLTGGLVYVNGSRSLLLGADTGVGEFSLYSNKTGTGNVAVGAYTLYANTTGGDNTGVGSSVMQYNTTGHDNTALGYAALPYNTSGIGNIGLGSYANYTSTGNYNIGLGYLSLTSTSSGSYNMAIGSYALGNLQQSGSITAFAPGSNTTVTSNGHGLSNGMSVTIAGTTHYNGTYTISNVTTNTFDISATYVSNDATGTWDASASQGNKNVAIGYAAGYNNKIGQGNIFIGYDSGYNELGSNKLYIANSNTSTPLIYGDFSAGSLTFNGNVTVGSGDTINGLSITNNGTNTLNIAAGKALTASNSLTFAGTDGTTFTFPTASSTVCTVATGCGGSGSGLSGTGSAGQVAFFSGSSSVAGDNGLSWDNTNKRLGIGLTGPIQALEVNGNVAVDGAIRTSDSFSWSQESPSFSAGTANQVAYIDLGNIDYWGWIDITLTGTYWDTSSTGALTKRFVIGRNQGAAIITQQTEVTSAFGDTPAEWSIGDMEVNGTDLRVPVYHLTTNHNAFTVHMTGAYDGYSAIQERINTLDISAVTTLANSATRQYTGLMESRYGFGTATPLNLADFAGGVAIGSYAGTNTAPSNGLIISGNVGIGTSSPSQALDIAYGNLNFDQLASPSSAPTATINPTAGNLNGGYVYNVTFVTATGETTSSFNSSYVSPANQQVDLTAIPTDPTGHAIARRIYRNKAGTYPPYYLVTTINDNTTTTYTDNTPDSSLGAITPGENTTGGIISVNGARAVYMGSGTNASLGFGALSNDTSRGYNTALGASALKSPSGAFNTAVGSGALYWDTSGQYNTANGASTLYSNTTGSGNTAIGMGTQYYNTTGSYNLAQGYNALYYNQTGSYNVALGGSALYSLGMSGYIYSFADNGSGGTRVTVYRTVPSGVQVTITGTTHYNGTWTISNGNYPTFDIPTAYVGNDGSGNWQATQVGNYNTGLGYAAGYSAFGSGNVFIGYEAGYNEIGSNKLYIANSNTSSPLIYGDFSAGALTFNGTTASTGLSIIGDGVTNYFKFDPANGPTYYGTARPAKTITLSAEYPGATLTTDGSATTNGSMTSDNTGSTKYENYYQWTSTQAAAQDYTIDVRVQLPSDFSAWQTNAVTMDYQTGTATATDNNVNLTIAETSGGGTVYSTTNLNNTALTALTITNTSLTGATPWSSAGQVVTFKIKLKADSASGALARVGDITLNYYAAR